VSWSAGVYIRDLASRYTIAWIPLPRGTARHVALALRRLFLRHHPPLVLKSDNGGCFVGGPSRSLLARSGVVHLRSPRAWPQYNGACEAGIGLLRALTDTAAATRGEPDAWALEDFHEARERANDLVRRHGIQRDTSRQVWRVRGRVGVKARRRLRALLELHLLRLRKEGPNAHRHRARLRRKAIQEALIEMGYLQIQSGWVRMRSTGPRGGPSYR
jgi:hypothetical protein